MGEGGGPGAVADAIHTSSCAEVCMLRFGGGGEGIVGGAMELCLRWLGAGCNLGGGGGLAAPHLCLDRR